MDPSDDDPTPDGFQPRTRTRTPMMEQAAEEVLGAARAIRRMLEVHDPSQLHIWMPYLCEASRIYDAYGEDEYRRRKGKPGLEPVELAQLDAALRNLKYQFYDAEEAALAAAGIRCPRCGGLVNATFPEDAFCCDEACGWEGPVDG